MDDIAYRLGFGARRRAELAAMYRDQRERAWLWRGSLRVHIGCLSGPLVLLAVVGVLAGAWVG